MKKYFVISLIVIASVGVFAAVGSFAGEDQASKVILVGAKQMMDGSQKIAAITEKNGVKDPGLAEAQRQIAEGYDLVLKGHDMMRPNGPYPGWTLQLNTTSPGVANGAAQ